MSGSIPETAMAVRGVDNAAFAETELPPSYVSNQMSDAKPAVKTTVVDSKTPGKEDVGTGCNLFGILPLPCFNSTFLTPPWILVFLCWASAIQGMVVNGFVNVVISTLEKRFGLQSTQTGVIAGCYDIGSMLSVIPIAYFGGRLGSSKPRYISSGLFLMGFGSLFFCLPHFLAGRYVPAGKDSGVDLCDSSETPAANSSSCVDSKAGEMLAQLSSYRYFFVFGQILLGVGAAPLITLGTTLLDESVSKKSSPFYIGIFQTMFVIGPAIGFMLGGSLLSIYTDFNVMSATELSEVLRSLSPSSPLWVGAWWLGFVIAWLMACACALFFACYPPALPGAHKHNQVKASDGFGSLRDLPLAIRALLTNPTYIFITLGSSMDGFSIAGMAAFLPKYLQSQFGLTSGLAAIVVGAVVVPAGGGGTFLGGYLTKRLRLTRSGVIKMYLYCQLVAIPFQFGYFFSCPNPPFRGVNELYGDTLENETIDLDVPHDFSSTCNQNCSCSRFKYNPVCGDDGFTYYNPCFAGCAMGEASAGENVTLNTFPGNFSHCECVDTASKTAAKDPCLTDCKNLYGFAFTLFVGVSFTFIASMPNVIATLRAVEPVHRSLALGLQSIILRLLGSIPGPVLIGYLFDRSCKLWQQVECQVEDGNCLFYNNAELSASLCATTVIVRLTGVLFFFVALFFSKRSRIRDDPDSHVETEAAEDMPHH